jgi:transcriptional regulator with XRE-family HTH domain
MFFMNQREITIYDERYRNLIASLVEFRKAQRITQDQVAAKIGLTRQNVSKVETCSRRLDILELSDWLNALGIKENLPKMLEKLLAR